MIAYLTRRALWGLVVLVGVSVVVFVMVRVLPGDPVQLMFPEGLSAEDHQRARARLGLDAPLHVQYITFMSQVLRGDLGDSYRHQRPVRELVLERLPPTAQLSAAALALSIVVGVPLGVLAAIRRNTLLDNVVMFVAMLGQSMPTFWLGIMLIVVFAVTLRWLPTSGMQGPQYLILPTLTLSGFLTALVARLVRSCMLDVLSLDYLRTARAKGLREFTVVVGHGLRNGLIPVVTILGLQIGTLLGGAVITETVFAWPGLGLLVVTAIAQRDYSIVQAVVLLLAVVFVLINLVVDVVYTWLDPRIRLA